jgi:hypothetical protein
MNIETLENLTTSSQLAEETKNIILNHVDEDYFEGWFEDLMQNGCVSGMVSELIYYCDTTKFYEKHQERINEMLKDLMWEIGADNMSGLFGDKFDSEDPLCLETTNQNLLAWFAFEETARNLANEIGLEI